MEAWGVISTMKHYEIISLYRNGMSFRKIAQKLDIDRKTVAKVCHRYEGAVSDLSSEETDKDSDETARQIVTKSKYDATKRKKRAFTPEVEKRLEELIESEELKTEKLGHSHKQKLTATAVYETLAEEGFKIGYRTVAHYWSTYNQKSKEAYIRQSYALGDRLEFDFGEVKLEIAGQIGTYYLAVMASPASGFYWAYLYTNQKQQVFLDAHIQFFEMVRGVYRELVYDNMRNVVTRFIGRGEKELNAELIKLSLYYGFDINVTNCFSGNEKGTVEGRVKHVRQKCFTKTYQFSTLEAARNHLTEQLMALNASSAIQEECAHLLAYREPYELAIIKTCQVNKYSCIQVEGNHYSVPDYLVGKTLQLKIYHETFKVFANQALVSEHKKIEGSGLYKLDIFHYLKTFQKKPGALKDSLALKQCPALHTLYQQHYKQKPKDFIAILLKYQDKPLENIVGYLKREKPGYQPPTATDSVFEPMEKDWQRLNQLFGLEVKI